MIKRVTVIALATGAVALALTGCGGSDNSSAADTDANGLRKGATSAPASSPAAQPTGAPATSSETPPTSTKAPANYGSLGPASSTTCGEFKKLEGDAEKAVIEGALAENPGSKFEGSPNVALGTAKLVCLAPSYADTPVAVAAGIVEKQ